MVEVAIEDEERIVLSPDGQFVVRRAAPALERLSWALYDFANTIYSMNVVTLYFAVWLIEDLRSSSTAYALATSLSSLLVALLIPILAAISDARRIRKPWVLGFTVASCAATALLGVLGRAAPADGAVLPLLACFVVANTCFQGALPFYNAMLPELAPPAEHGRLSGYGTALGYLGSIAGVVLVAPFVTGALPLVGPLPPAWIAALHQVPTTAGGGRAAAFVPTAILFLFFSLPFALFTRDHLAVPRRERRPIVLGQAIGRVVEAVRDTRRHPGVLRLVIASYFYQDVLGTVIAFMAVYAVAVMGFRAGAEATLFVVLTVPAILGSAAAGLVADRLGPRRTLLGVLVLWILCLLAVIAARTRAQFWAAGAAIGLVFGGVWATERPLLLTLVPGAESGRFFGLLVLSARAAAVCGPLLWALIVDHLAAPFGVAVAYRAAVGALALIMLVAIALVAGVPDRRRRAESLQ